jgi:hypothetical protein
MRTTQTNGEPVLGDATWELPPLILHPFADREASDKLLEDSRSVLAACGLGEGTRHADELQRRRLEGRFSEIRMLYFVGKDVVRWIGQCVEFSERIPDLRSLNIREQSFGALLTQHMPEAVEQKLQGWGVHDAGAIFSRAIGLNQIFATAPEFEMLADDFIFHYHRYADCLFSCWQQIAAFREVSGANFHFDLYASGEYTRMLENEWGGAG